MRFLITVLAVTTTFAVLASVAAASSSVKVTALDCGSHPRRIRIENLGDTAQDLSGWQLQSDPVEGQPYDLGVVGSLGAGQKFFVFQGHLSPAQDPEAGYYRWGSDEIFNLRANDSSDYVRIVDAQGNTVDQRNCEGLPPGATPAPTTEFDPPPLVVATDTPAPTPAPEAPAPTAAPVRGPGATPKPASAGGTTISNNAPPDLPAQGGGPPMPAHTGADTSALAAAAALMLGGVLLAALGLKRRESGSS